MHKGIAASSVQIALEKTGMSIKELSRRSGVNYHTARNGIKGKTTMQAEHFILFADVLNIDLQQGVLNGASGINSSKAC